MTRSEPSAILAAAMEERGAIHDERPSCLACGARISRGEPTIKIHCALVHLNCAVQRRRVARR